MGATVRRIRPEDASTFRRLRLSALATDPLAFGSTSAREEAYPENHWTEWTSRDSEGEGEAIFLVAEGDAAAHGMVGAFSKEGEKHLWGMWVVPERRGSGSGAALLRAVLAWCEAVSPELPVRLEVNPTQRAAIRLYQQAGFRATGEIHPLGHHEPATVHGMERSVPDRRVVGPVRGPPGST
jgi:GNAT superfamily N-acetyltransferase